VSDDWVCVHVAANRAEADLLAERLRSEGIKVVVRGGNNMIEESIAYPEILVPGDAVPRAREMLEPVSEDTERTPALRREMGRGGKRFIAGLACGVVLGGFVVLLGFRRMEVPTGYEGTYTEDGNGDGKPDEWERYRNGVLEARSWDGDHDGKADAWEYYVNDEHERTEYDWNRDGRVDERCRHGKGDLHTYERDLNFDGRFDAWTRSDGNGCIGGSYDLDYDGKPDEWRTCKYDQTVERRWSLRRDGVVDKKAFYRHGIKTEERLDMDRDGVFEIRKEFDAMEQEKAMSP